MASSWCATFSLFTASKPPVAACPPSMSKKPAASRQAASCMATGGGRGDGDDGRLPRLDILAGMGGVAAGLAAYPGLPSAALKSSPHRGDMVNDKLVVCTDPNSGFPCPNPAVVDFSGVRRSKPRVRRPVHLLTPEEQEKYEEAVWKMRALPDCNPLSFAAQAAIHQAYCDSHYRYGDNKESKLFDVHFSWLFAPWHRMYIYLYEKTLGDLIGDNNFALPYWNWDTPAVMVVPAIFAKQTKAIKDGRYLNALYDSNRNYDHLGKLVLRY